jgi:hypothetical protein
MVKKIVVAGLLAGVVMIGWTLVVNGVLRFRVALDMNQMPNEREVYRLLETSIPEPGRYVCNPEPTDSGFPPDEPVFSVLYGGVGHEAAGMTTLLQLLLAFIVPVLATWLLSLCSPRVLSSYGRKVAFFAAIGLLIGLTSHLTEFGIGGYPLTSALVLFAHEIALWTAMGLVVAWRLKPAEPARGVSV